MKKERLEREIGIQQSTVDSIKKIAESYADDYELAEIKLSALKKYDKIQRSKTK